MDEGSQDKLLTEVAAGLSPTVAALVKERISPEALRDLTMQAAVNAARHHDPSDTLSKSTINELRRLIPSASLGINRRPFRQSVERRRGQLRRNIGSGPRCSTDVTVQTPTNGLSARIA